MLSHWSNATTPLRSPQLEASISIIREVSANGEFAMNLKRFATCSAFALLFAFGATIPASYAQSQHDDFRPSPKTTFPNTKLIYVAVGAFDSGDPANTGLATTVTCRNLTNSDVTVVFRFFDGDNNMIVGSKSGTIAAQRARTVSSHATFNGEAIANTGYFDRGTVAIFSTDTAVFCSAMVVDAAGTGAGFALHMVRFRKHNDTDE
jgi:hypothetical protein